MTVKIKINCETVRELTTHLNEIITIIKVKSRNNPDYDFEVGTHFQDNNCYGTHEVEIIPE